MRQQPALLDIRRPSRCGSTCRPPATSHAHCAAAGCHRTLASVSDFDRHRADGHCVHPALIGLIEKAGLWASPERHANDEALAARLAEGRAARRHTAPDAPTSPVDGSVHPHNREIESEPLEATRAA